MKTPLQILHKYFHHFNSERTRDLVVRAMEDYAKIYHETEVKKLQQHGVSGKRPSVKELITVLHEVASHENYKAFYDLMAACASGALDTKPAREVCIKGGERLENGECAKCNLLWGKCCAELL